MILHSEICFARPIDVPIFNVIMPIDIVVIVWPTPHLIYGTSVA
jgi:hypothetical protein